MENSQSSEPAGEDNKEVNKETKKEAEAEKPKPMPFGVLGVMLLVGLLQFAAFFGITVLILAIVILFGPK